MHESKNAKLIAEFTIILEGIRDKLSAISASNQACLKSMDRLIERVEEVIAHGWFPDSAQPARAKRGAKQS